MRDVESWLLAVGFTNT